MPTYEFRCPNGHEFEQFYSRISLAPSVVECPTCGAVSVKLMSAGGLVFKGSGFYITDYGKDGKKDQQPPAAATAGDSAPSSDASKPAPGDAKPAGESTPSGDAKPSSDAKPSGDGKAKSDAKPAKAAESTATKSPPKSSGGDA